LALRKGYRRTEEKCAVDGCILEIKDLPTVDAVEVVHGRWIKTNKYDEDSSVQCSKCLMEFDYIDGVCYLVIGSELPNYCPNCGADMRGDES
jgi:hypothetical protein